MSHFYGTLSGNRGQATRAGSKNSGMTTHCASWSGAVRCSAWHKDGEDWVEVKLIPWHGSGKDILLYRGPISGAKSSDFSLKKRLLKSDNNYER